MKKTALTFLIILTAIGTSCSEMDNNNNDWKKLNLKNKVKSISEQNYEAIEENGNIFKGNKSSNSELDIEVQFNKNGFLTQKTMFDINGKMLNHYKYEYNDKNLLEKTTKYTPTENIDKVYVHLYNKENMLETEITYTALGNTEYTDKYIYQNNLLLSQETYTANGNLYCKWEYQYNKNGKKTKADWHINNTLIQTSYRYNDKDELIEQEELNQDQIKTRWKYEYDNYGNISKEICIFSDNSEGIKKYEYVYDEHKNWTKKITFDNEFPSFITERTINYY